LKDALMNFAAENFETASYRSLAEATQDCGHPEIATTCEGIMREEEQMAQWVNQQLPRLTGVELRAASQDAGMGPALTRGIP
jgi:ferritin-like metal-binding protein YciE